MIIYLFIAYNQNEVHARTCGLSKWHPPHKQQIQIVT